MNKQYGIALILTLWLILALAAMASVFVSLIQLESRAVNNYKFETKALALAEAGVVHAISLLKNDTNGGDSSDDEWTKPVNSSLGDGTYSVTIVDEERKININGASEAVLSKLGLSQDIVREIIKYRNDNGMFDDISEMLMIEGISKDIYQNSIKGTFTTWGQININLADKKVLDALMIGLGIKEKGLADKIKDGQPFTSVDDFLEIVDKETYELLKSVGTTTGVINVNTVSDSILSAYGIDPTTIKRPVKTSDGMEQGMTVSSRYFSITATGNSHDICKTIYTVCNRTMKDKKWEIKVVYWLENE